MCAARPETVVNGPAGIAEGSYGRRMRSLAHVDALHLVLGVDALGVTSQALTAMKLFNRSTALATLSAAGSWASAFLTITVRGSTTEVRARRCWHAGMAHLAVCAVAAVTARNRSARILAGVSGVVGITLAATYHRLLLSRVITDLHRRPA